MSTLRQDPTNRQWVVLAPRRGDRPHVREISSRPPVPAFDASCPFCPGNEGETPPEILRRPRETAWNVRVVPNLFGALQGDGTVERSGPPMFREMPGVGGHEVVIESPRHDARLDEMPAVEVEEVVSVWRERYRSLLERPEVRAVVVFKNFGRLAGTSLVHTHSQVVGTPVFLPRLMRRLDVAARYFDEHGHCVYDDLVSAELQRDERVIARRGDVVALSPFAAASPFETWILPTRHAPSFGSIDDEEIADLSGLLVDVLGGLRHACEDPDFNLVLYSAPHAEDETFHWHLKVLPKLTTPAGFEMASAMSINTVAPEEAAAVLRTAIAERASGAPA
jgi:UDPglucose--hexose-1-phosphate uridylyltransferase